MSMTKSPSNKSLSDLNAEVDEVTKLLKTNVEKILDRGERINNLHERSANLDNNAIRFQKSSVEVRKKARWKNIKLNVFIIVSICMFLGILAGIIVGVFPKHTPTPVHPTTPTTSTSQLLRKLHSF